MSGEIPGAIDIQPDIPKNFTESK